MKMGKPLFVLLCTVLLAVLVALASAQAEEEEYEYKFCGDTLIIKSKTNLLDNGYLSWGGMIGGLQRVQVSNPFPDDRIYVTVSGTATNHCLFFEGNIDITLDNLSMEVNGGQMPSIYLRNNFNGTLLLRGSNRIVNNNEAPALGMWHGSHASIKNLVESEPASLLAKGGPFQAGINVGRESDGSNPAILNIKSGTVTAIAGPRGEGGTGGAGIGGADQESGGVINIHGGVVTAIGVKGAGIGGGNRSANGGEITITGGTVIAYSDIEGAGIGGGDDDSDGGQITITGGFVTAISGRLAAGIGGGNNGTSGKITITGGTVIAAGGGGGAGIGGGHHDNNDGGNVDEILITGGVILPAERTAAKTSA